MTSCGMSCVKYLVFFFNFLFALTGLLVLTVGAIIESSYHHYSNFVGESFWTAPILLIVIGAIVFVVAFFGCCGAAKESSCMILTFSVMLVVIFVTEIGIGIAGYVKHGELREILEKGFNKTLENYNKSTDSQHAWALVQGEMECCGINGPDDWERVFTNNTLPKSCCPQMPVDKEVCSKEYSLQGGCLPKLYNFLEINSLILAWVGIGIALVQLLGVVFACCLSRAFRASYETV